MLHFKLPSAHSVRIPTGEAQGFTPLRTPRACCHIGPQTDWRSSGQAASELPMGGGRLLTWGFDESALHTLGGKCARGDDRFPRVGRWNFGLGPPVSVLCVCRPRFFTCGCFLLRGCSKLGLRLLRPGGFPSGGHFKLLRILRDRLRRGIWIGLVGGVAVAWTTRPPRKTLFHPLAQIHLISRWPGPLTFRSDRLACVSTLFRQRRAPALKRASFAYFHFTQTR